MNYGIDRMFREHRLKRGSITAIPFDQRAPLHSRTVSATKVVQDQWVKPNFFEELARMTSDISGSAGHENVHQSINLSSIVGKSKFFYSVT